MIRFFRVFFFRALYLTGLGHLLKYYNTKKNFVPILLFHRVSDTPDPYWPPLTKPAFQKIIQFFAGKYNIRSIADLLSYSPGNLTGSCFIVFDDAYKDFLENALPFLRENKIPVTMFVPVESIETGKPIWTTWLNICIDGAAVNQLTINDGERKIEYDLSGQAAKINTAHSLLKWLKTLSYRQNIYWLDQILKQTGKNANSMNISVMNWTEINETKEQVDYQSHTMTHPMLGNIKDREDLSYEMGEAKKIISSRTGISTNFISYPIGSYSKDVIEESKKHYNLGFAVDERLVDLKKMNDADYRYKIPRFNVSDADPYELFFRVNGFHKIFKR